MFLCTNTNLFYRQGLLTRYRRTTLTVTVTVFVVLLLYTNLHIDNRIDETKELDKVCSIKKIDKLKQKKGLFCDDQCTSWSSTLSLNSHALPSQPEKLNSVCQGEDAVNCVQPFKTILSDLQYFWKLNPAKTLLCTIPKTSSQLLNAVMCLLNNETDFFYNAKSFFGQYYTLACSDNRIHDIDAPINTNEDDVRTWDKLTVVRDPVDRFLSGFLFACVRGVDYETSCTRYCHGCGANLTCFVDRQYEEMMRLSRGEHDKVDFLIHHQYPQTWRCGMNRFKNDYTIIKYNSNPKVFVPQILDYLKSKNVSLLPLQYIERMALKISRRLEQKGYVTEQKTVPLKNVTQERTEICEIESVPWDEIITNNSFISSSLQHSYNKICEEEDTAYCVKPFLSTPLPSTFFVLKTHETIFCPIPKTSSQLTLAIMCLTNDPLSFFYNQQQIFRDYNLAECNKTSFRNMTDGELTFGSDINSWTKLAVVRDPIDRFLSAFLFVCVRGYENGTECTHACYGCGANLTCFVERQYEALMKFEPDNEDDLFLMRHMWPQNWRCDMQQNLENFTIIKYDSNPKVFVPKIIDFLEAKNVSTLATKYIKDVVLNKRTYHSTYNSKARTFFEGQLRSSLYLMEKVVRMYYHDFKLFGFLLPQGFE
ncbi:unnamed protein product [Bursaphelenchus okinawaensis]|uniref:Sulfotransfer_1 domain-containing protein n=1 Tax=Bursaphelenchus okinawaensis TaxID=465554 RepID=A0A811KFQ9_9BILA|nr:unnamed protein product [Bursaphelenchus okinawaensis]CAG9101333.1 unnamed protein product [Bursaphelenchus okinawaensis]